jgi:hypothetical protein
MTGRCLTLFLFIISVTKPENFDRYFQTFHYANIIGVFFGAINNQDKTARPSYGLNYEKRIFYVNPAEATTLTLQSHTHVLITNQTTMLEFNTYLLLIHQTT